MVDVYEKKMCNYCKNSNCKKRIEISSDKGVTIYKCEEYVRNEGKIFPYQKPLVVTAKREFVKSQLGEV